MKFSIITPTYKRRDLLERAIQSVLRQTYTEWEMIIVNDSPDDSSYKTPHSFLKDPRIHYYVNDANRGVNYSRNRAIDSVSKDSDWIIFLDDDDYLTPDALATLNELATAHPECKWFVTNRAYADGTLVTEYPKPENWYSYIRDVLILKRCKGDVTHCIKSDLLIKIRYSKYIKQAEEWLFYYQIALTEKMFYHKHNSTLTDGYDKVSGLNFRKRTKKEQFEALQNFIREGHELHILHHPTFMIYLFMRAIRTLIK